MLVKSYRKGVTEIEFYDDYCKSREESIEILNRVAHNMLATINMQEANKLLMRERNLNNGAITIQDCIDMYEINDEVTIIRAGKVIGFAKKEKEPNSGNYIRLS